MPLRDMELLVWNSNPSDVFSIPADDERVKLEYHVIINVGNGTWTAPNAFSSEKPRDKHPIGEARDVGLCNKPVALGVFRRNRRDWKAAITAISNAFKPSLRRITT
jgi:hypothetical protein